MLHLLYAYHGVTLPPCRGHIPSSPHPLIPSSHQPWISPRSTVLFSSPGGVGSVCIRICLRLGGGGGTLAVVTLPDRPSYGRQDTDWDQPLD